MRLNPRYWLAAGPTIALALGVTLPLAAQEEEAEDFPVGRPTHHGEVVPFDRKIDPSAIKLPPGYKVEVFATGLTFPTDITFGPNGEAYVSEAGGHFYGTDPSEAPPPRILQIMPDGTKRVVYDNAVSVEAIRNAQTAKEIPEGLIGPMEGITYNPRNGLIYVAHRTRYSTLNPQTGEFRTIIGDLPAWGIFHNTKVIFDGDGKMVFGISSQGNAGPVDFAIMKVASFFNKPMAREVPCEDVTLTGQNYKVHNGFTPEKGDSAKTGVYVPYGTETTAGQTVEGQFWCNSAFYRVDPDGTNAKRIAWGIRNAFHYEFSSDGRLIATNNSCNPIPGRPVYDDWETVYEVKEGLWYGWPDYCSGLPITDQRFSKPNDPQFKGKPFPHKFALNEETRQRLLKGQPRPPQPLVKLTPHAATQGFKFGRASFGIPENEILVAEYGAVIPYMVAGKQEMPGFQVSRVNLETGKRTPFMHNKSGKPASAAPGQPAPQGGGLERPIRMEYGPDGALYLVDFGVFDVHPKPKDKPKKVSYNNTGVIWKVTYTGDQMQRERTSVRKGGR
jgi:glucose/arabinose dehydrogenase